MLLTSIKHGGRVGDFEACKELDIFITRLCIDLRLRPVLDVGGHLLKISWQISYDVYSLFFRHCQACWPL